MDDPTFPVQGDALATTRTAMLDVGVLLDSHVAEEWVVALLERLAAHPRLRPRVIVSAAASREAARRPPGGVVRRMVRTLVRSKLIDSSRQVPSARRPQALPDALIATAMSAADVTSADIDVLLDLGVRDHALERRLGTTPLWSARVEDLVDRVERALLARATLLWLHLWRREAGAIAGTGAGAEAANDAASGAGGHARMASHSLPLQSRSLIDLSEMAFRALPALLVTRLNWFALGRDPLDVERATLPADAVDADRGDEDVFRVEQAGAVTDAGRACDGRGEPGGLQQALAGLRLLARRQFDGVDNRLSKEIWELAVTVGTDAASRASVLERVRQTSLERWRAVASPRDHIWADPHICRHDGVTHVFFEELGPGDPHGHISVIRLDADGALIGAATRALAEPFHLSYPFVFEHDGEHWMIPETASRRTVSLYRATRFPDEWRHERDLLTDVDRADSTLHRHDGRWWMFTNRFSADAVNERDELLLYHADTLTGPWRPHALNPVMTGVDRARMAGPVFEDGGHHYRPSQYGAVRYGHGVNIARIEELTPEVYRETPVRRLCPGTGSGWLGCHSLASAGALSIVDRFERRWRW